MRRADRGALVLAALAGASAWISLGTLALAGDRGARVGALPSAVVAIALVVIAVGLAWAVRLRTRDAWPLALTGVLWLPWLPSRLPPAMLLWEGRAEAAIWIAAILGLVAARAEGRRLRWAADTRRAPWLVAALLLACATAAAARLSHHLPAGDEPHYLVIAQSLARDGDLRIENNHARGDHLDYAPRPLPPDFLRRGVDGEIYSVHAPGLPALLAGPVAAGGYPAAVLVIIVVCAATLGGLWRLTHGLTGDARAAWAATLALGASTPVFLHTFVVFPEPIGAAIVASALGLLVRLDRSADEMSGSGATMSSRWLVMVGALLAVLPWLHTRFALVAGAAGSIVALRIWRYRARTGLLTAFLAVPAISAAMWFAHFWIVYGTPDPSAPYGDSRQTSIAWIVSGATGLLLDQRFGLLPNAPVLALVPVGWWWLWRARPRLAIELAAIAVPYAAIVASFAMWWGGWSAPARFLVAVLPLAVPPLAYAWLNGSAMLRLVFGGLAGLGALLTVARVVVLDGLTAYGDRASGEALMSWASRSVDLSLALPEVHRTGIAPALVAGAVWVLSGGAGVVLAERLAAGRAWARGTRWAVAAGVAIVAVGVAASVSWRLASVSPLSSQASAVSWLDRWDPDVRPIAIGIYPWRATTTAALIEDLTIAGRSGVPVDDPAALLTVDWLPAGTYRLLVEGAPQLAGTMTAIVGEAPSPLETWTLDGMAAGRTSLVLSLPVALRSLTLRGDEAALPRLRRVSLQVERVAPRKARLEGIARSAARYGGVRVFALDDGVSVEPAGLWTRGDDRTAVVFTGDESGEVEVMVGAGPVPAVLEARAGAWSGRVELAPGESHPLRWPAGAMVRLRTTGRFRPVDADPAVRDERPLGVRIEVGTVPR